MTTWLPRGFAVLFLSLLFVVGVGSWSASSRTQAADAKDAKLKALRKERLATLQEVAAQTTKAYQNGVPSVSFAQILEANQAVGNAELDLCDTDQERIAALEKLLAAAKEAEKLAEQLEKKAKAPAGSALKAKAIRLDVEIALAVAIAAPDEAEIARLVKQLGHNEFIKREEATTRLKEIGEPALDTVTKAATSGDPEVRRRAENIVAVIETKLCEPELCLTGHTGVVCTVSISADGKRLLTSGEDKTLRLWDTATGKCLRVFEGHTERVIGAALSPDGQRVLSGSADKTVRLWDATTGKELRKMTGHTSEVPSVVFGPDGKAISGGTEDRTMQLWDLNTGKNAGVFTGHTASVHCVTYSDQAKRAATCSHDQSIRVWDLESGKEVRNIPGQSGNNNMVLCFSPDGKRLLSAGVDFTLHILDVETGKELKRIKDANAYCAAFSLDGKRLVSGGGDNTVRVWDAATGKELRNYDCHAGVTCVAFFPDGKRIASASIDGTARIWRAPR